jgi:stage III sporulation protein AE
MIIILILMSCINVSAETTREEIVEEQYETVGISELDRIINNLTVEGEYDDIIPDFSVKRVAEDMVQGKSGINLKYVPAKVSEIFLKEIYINIHIMLQVIILTIICAVLSNLEDSFGKEGIGQIAFFACYIYLIGIMVRSFTYVVGIGREVIDNMVMFMQSAIPVMVTLLTATGSITSATIFQPIIIFIVQIIGTVVKSFLIPLVFLGAAISIVDNVSEKININKLSEFINQLVKWSLGLFLTAFIGVVTIQGIASSVVDGIGGRTAKYAVSAFIPVVGGILSDAVETIIGCSLIMKNAVGILGLTFIAIICFIPLMKIVAIVFIYRITTAIIEPVSDKRIIQCISGLSNSVVLLLSLVVSVAVMFFISITVIVATGNIASMFR